MASSWWTPGRGWRKSGEVATRSPNVFVSLTLCSDLSNGSVLMAEMNWVFRIAEH